MRIRGVLSVAGVCGSCGVAIAGPTWSAVGGDVSATAARRLPNGGANQAGGTTSTPFFGPGLYDATRNETFGNALAELALQADGAEGIVDVYGGPDGYIHDEQFSGLFNFSFTADQDCTLNAQWTIESDGNSNEELTITFFLLDVFANTSLFSDTVDNVTTYAGQYAFGASESAQLQAGRTYVLYSFFDFGTYGNGDPTNYDGSGSGWMGITLDATAVPLPSVSAMAALGLVGLTVGRRRVVG